MTQPIKELKQDDIINLDCEKHQILKCIAYAMRLTRDLSKHIRFWLKGRRAGKQTILNISACVQV